MKTDKQDKAIRDAAKTLIKQVGGKATDSNVEVVLSYFGIIEVAVEKRELSKTKLAIAAKKLLHKIDNMTTDQFAIGAERVERENLRAALTELGTK